MAGSSIRVIPDTVEGNVENWNTDTILLDEEKMKHIQELRPEKMEAINNVYELPSMEKRNMIFACGSGIPITGNLDKSNQSRQ